MGAADDVHPGLEALGLATIMAAYTLAVTRFWWTVDDAFISFRYARNLARGDGLRFNLGDHIPVEGYSNLGC